jgi:periplasmic protein CpxP/Spy
MRTLLTTLALAAGMTLMAQDADMDDNGKKTPDERAQHRTEWMTKELGLSPEQIAKVNPINITYARAISEVKDMKDVEAKKTRSKALRDKRDADLKAVLTPEQFTKLTTLREQKEGKKDKEDKKGKKDKTHNE